MLNQLDGRPLTLPIVYDLEDPAPDSRFHLANLNRQQVTDLCRAFCETIEANGYEAAVYTNPNWIQNILYLDQLSDFPLWLAHYTSALLPPVPTAGAGGSIPALEKSMASAVVWIST